MKTKIKKIIAREGLIIISLMLLAGIAFLLDSWVKNPKAVYESDFQQIEPILRLRPGDKEFDKYIGEHQAKGVFIDPYEVPVTKLGIILQFPKRTSDAMIKQTIKRDFPDIKFDSWLVSDNPYMMVGMGSNAYYTEKGEWDFISIIHNSSIYMTIHNSIMYDIDYSFFYMFFC